MKNLYKFVVVCLMVLQFTPGQALALDPGLPPGGNFDLSHWYLQLPTWQGVLTGTTGSVDSVSAADLVAGYTSDYFYTATDGSMAFWAPNNGAMTSGSTHPRSELREQLSPPNNNSWSVYGTHIITATLKVTQVSPDTGKVCIGQMKGGYKVDGSIATNTEQMIMFDLNNQKIYANIAPDGNSGEGFSYTFVSGSGVALSNTITYTMSLVDGLLKIIVNNVTNSWDLLSGIEYSPSTDPGLLATNWDRVSGNALYFKAGSYNQSTNGLADQGARVAFSSLTRYHSANITNQPVSSTVAGGSNATFAVGASGNGTLSYQWRLGTNNLAGKTNSTLTLNSVSVADAGEYTVVVSDNTSSFSAITSAVATLTVANADIYTAAGVTNWVCPDGVYSVQVECWGGGGAGGSAQRIPNTSNVQYGGGAAGGAYAKYNSYAVIPGNTYYINVGAGGTNNSTVNGTTVAGEDSWFNSVNAPSAAIIAKGGAGGASRIGNSIAKFGEGGAGTTNGCAGDVVYAGGSGATANITSGTGGGGSSAGPNSAGTAATSNIGATAPAGGGNGGTGPTYSSGTIGGDGYAPGGGGSGARGSSDTLRTGGKGAAGQVILIYTAGAAPTSSVSATASMPIGDGTGTGGLTVYEGSSITLTENPSDGTAPFTYAWKQVGSETVLGTDNTLLISSPTNGAQYTCDVAATWDGVTNTSPAATLTVLPLVSATASVPTGDGAGTGGLTIYEGMNITLTETPSAGTEPFTYAWKQVGSETVLGTDNTLLISSPTNGAQYTCDVAATWDGVTNTSPAATVTVASPREGHPSSLLSVDFESDSPGANPAVSNAIVRPIISTATNYVTVVDSSGNAAGAGQGIRFNDTGIGVGTALEYNFVADTAAQISLVQASFDFSCITSNTGTTGYISVGLGAYNAAFSMSSSAARWNELRLYQDNTLRIVLNGSSTGSYFPLNEVGTSNTLVMFVNDSLAPFNYTFNGTQTLAANSVAYWLNGALISTMALDTEVLVTTNNFGKIGFSTSTTAVDMNYAFDNIAVSEILLSSVSAMAAMPTGSGTGTGGLTVYEGSSITLTETPSAGTAPFTYVWKQVGAGDVLGTNSTLLISSPTNGAQYTCDVAATWDGVTNTSPAATVTVLPPVSATASTPTGNGSGAGGLTVYEGSSITLTETPSAGTVPFTYAWKKTGSDTVLGTDSTLLISSPTNGAQYTCDVAATWNGVTNTSPAATVTVLPPVSATAGTPTGNGSGTGGMTVYPQRTRMTLTETPSSGTAPFTYVWKKVGSGTVLGTNSTLTISPLVDGDQYVCDVAATWDGVTNTSAAATVSVTTVINSNKVVFIKADDFRASNWSSPSWTNFLIASRNLGIKVNPGAVVTNIDGNASIAQWMQGQEAAGDVEFWNHGWDHSQWTVVNGSVTTTVYEFKGSDLAFQQTHLADAQAGLSNALGHDVIAFGTPYNQFDTNTTALVNDTPALKLFFATSLITPRSAGLDTRVDVVKIIGESPPYGDGTGMPNAETFKSNFPSGPTGPVALQFHPADSNFDTNRVAQYQEIVQYLLTNGYVFLMPAEYLASPETTYSLTVTSGSGSGSYSNGAQVAITADMISGKVFDRWIGDTQYVNNVTYTNALVTMPTQDVVLTATYVDVYYALTVNGGGGGGSYTNGHVQAIVANAAAPGMAFVAWTGDTVYLANSNSASTTVTMPTQAVSVTATYIATEQYTTNAIPVPYSWLAEYGITNNQDAAVLLDPDGDGLTTEKEYIAGTVPTNAASVLKAVQAVRNVVTWTPQSNRIYSVYWSTNLVKGFSMKQDNILYPQSSYTNATPDSRVNHYQIKVRLQ
jgi:peptidoglycan/xylan/chitin deacetylase (PgdA/CDA1 family)